MSGRARLLLTLAIPLAFASVFIRLGVWQLDRLSERRAFNKLLAGRGEAQAIDLKTLTTDTSLGHYRRVTVSGRFDYEHQIVYAGRSRQGSPGVYLLTPLRSEMGDTVVLVNRGWVYSPDAGAVDESRWREGDSAKVTGYAETYVRGDPKASPSNPRRLHALDFATVERLVGAPIAPYFVVRTDTAATPVPGAVDSVPARLEIPPLDEGPHQSYAIQWFAFATIAVVGGVLLARISGR
jgi:surfeit locus 1 family protein